MKTPKKKTAENFIKDIRRNTRRIFSSEQKIQIVMEALRAEMSVAELCRKYSINESQFYKWNKEFLEAGKKRLAGEFVYKRHHLDSNWKQAKFKTRTFATFKKLQYPFIS